MNRSHWLESQIKTNSWKKGVELGVLRGPTFMHLVNNCPGYTHYGVDVFVSDKVWKAKNITTTEDLLKEDPVEWYAPLAKFAAANGAFIIRDFSHLAASKFEDNSIDFVFIDAGHGYDDVVKDMTAWIPKVKKEGMVSGHDINMLDVKLAVNSIRLNYQIGPDNIWFYTKE